MQTTNNLNTQPKSKTTDKNYQEEVTSTGRTKQEDTITTICKMADEWNACTSITYTRNIKGHMR